jgi:tyrosinase
VTDIERAQYLRTLQRHFGQKPTVQRDNQIAITQSLFTTNSEESLPEKHEPVYNFRQFVVVVELVEHAFEGSHFLEVSYTSKDGQTYPVGATAVLGRTHGTQCAGCRERRRGHSKVHDAIHIPHDVVVKIITDHDLNHPRVGDDELCKSIRDSFHAQIVSPSGIVRAQADLGAPNRHGVKPVDETVLPQLRLASANVSAIRDRNEDIQHPWEFYDWKDHGSVLGNKWVVPA